MSKEGYIVCREDSIPALLITVDIIRAKGFKLVGGVSAYLLRTAGIHYLQAMVKEEQRD